MPHSRAHNLSNGRRGRDEMARIRGSLLVLAFFGALVLAPLATVLLFPDRALEEIRPWLERVASDRLEGRVRIDRLSLQPLGNGRLRVEGVHFEREGTFRVDIPRLEAEFTFGGLWVRRLETLRLLDPTVTVWAPAGGGEGFPEEPPLTVRRLEITGGRAKVQVDGDLFRLREVEGSAALDHRSPFRIAARVGAGEGIPLTIAGTALLGEEPAIILDEAAWGERPLLAEPITVRLPAGAAAGTVRLDRFDHVHLRSLLAAFERQSPLPAGWGFALLAPELRFRLSGTDLEARLRVSEATLTTPDFSVPLQEFDGEIAGWSGWQGRGTFRLAGMPARLTAALNGERLSGTLAINADDPGALKRHLVGGEMPPLAGGLDLAATFVRADGAIRIEGKAQGRPGAVPARAVLDLAPLAAEVTAKYSAAGAVSADGKLLLRDRELARVRATATEVRIELRPATGRELQEILPTLREALPAGSQGIAGTASLARRGAGEWKGDIRLQASRLPLPEGDLREVELHAPVVHAPDGTMVGPGVLGAALQGEGVSARLGLEGSGELRAGEYSLDVERLTLDEVEYLAADGLSALSGGRLVARGAVAGATAGGEVRVDLAATFAAREILYGRIYADVSTQPIALGVRGTVDPGRRRLRGDTLTFEIAGVGRGEGRGELAPGAAAFAGTLAVPDLAAAWDGPLGQAVAALRSDLPELRPVGAIEVDVSVRWQEGEWRLTGEARPEGVDIDWPKGGLVARDLRGRVPFDLRSAAMQKGESRRGELRLSELRLGPATMGEAVLTFLAAPNRLQVESPLVFSLAGGTVEVAETAVSFAPAGFEGGGRVRLRDLDLTTLTRTLGWTEMAGRVSADLGRIRYANDTIAADGLILIDAFGGKIRVGGLRLESFFSDYPTVEADAGFTGIDLQQLTRTFEFGEINGIADGYVRGLRLFGTTPSAFEAVLETREEGRRNISVKALNNLSVISQGGFSAILSRGIYRFIDFYRYRKIGIACSLRRDVFTLYGTARPDSDRYLVYGGWLPPKIDVVAPAHTISFKEMLRRLQRIERAETPEAAGN